MLSNASRKIPLEELMPIRDLVAEVAGLYFETNKFYFIEKRIQKRIRATNSESARDYFRLLKHGDYPEEMKELIANLTINETYFYRNIPQLESFSEEALHIVTEEKRKRDDYCLNIWSAACSSGEEPYTIAILLREYLPDFEKWHIKILATDIDHHILERAMTGRYDSRSVKDVPQAILEKYFQVSDKQYRIRQEIREAVQFRNLNLMDRRSIRIQTPMDFVFCRNVLIYFSDMAKKQVINSLYDNLRQGGFIFLGHTESVGRLSAAFKLVKLEKSLSYKK